MKRIAINGFGRIGRILFRILHEKTDYEIVAINDVSSPKVLSHLLKYDSIHGKYHRKISFTDNSIVVDSQKKDVFSILSFFLGDISSHHSCSCAHVM